MTEEELQSAFASIAEENQDTCPGIAAEDVRAIRQVATGGVMRGRYAQDPCFTVIRSALENRGLLEPAKTAEEVAANLSGGWKPA